MSTSAAPDRILDDWKAGYPSLCILTQEPDRAKPLLFRTEHWEFFCWDFVRGIRQYPKPQVVDEVRDPVEAIQWLDHRQDTVLINHNLHLFLDIPEQLPTAWWMKSPHQLAPSCLTLSEPTTFTLLPESNQPPFSLFLRKGPA